MQTPTGIVTFLFTDVEGSTRLWAADAERTASSLERHDRIIREAIEARGGHVFGWAGDHFRGAFDNAKVAVAAAIAAQTALGGADWDDGPALRVRMGLHRGRATQRDSDYFGPVPNTAARLEAAAAGGQILMSAAVASAVDVESLALGSHRLRDVPEPVVIHQVGVVSFPPIRVVDPSLSTLPHPGSRLIGRDGEVAQARQQLDTAPMVTLTGTGGCGKTRLAVEIAHQELPSRSDGCYFVDLSAVSEGSELPAALATSVRLELGGPAPALDQVVDHLAGRDALVVLDNCEHILEQCAEFAEHLLARSSSTAVLATTRQRLEVPGEQVIAVGSLDHRGAAPAVELFVERARVANPGFVIGEAPDDPTIGVIEEICRRLDGMPLPIELAAARISVLTPTEILDRMEDRFKLLSGGRGRQKRRTLQATLDWSYDLLDADEQLFFRRCGVFVGPFDLASAVAVSGFDDYEAMDLLESLVAKSLLSIDDSPDREETRYRLLETIRIYAGDQLARSEDVTGARDAHLTWFRRRAEAPDFAVAAGLRRADDLRHDWANIASALEWAMVRGPAPDTGETGAQTAARIAFGCQGLWETRIPAIEGLRWLRTIGEGLQPGPELDWVRYVAAVLCIQIDRFAETHRLLEELTGSEETQPEVRAQAMGLFAFLCCRRRPERVPELAARAASECAAHGLGGEFLAPSVWAEACLHLYDHEFDEARSGFEQAHALLEASPTVTNHLVVSGLTLAAAEILTGDPSRALETIEATDASLSIWDSSAIVQAIALVDLGRPTEAADLVIGFGYEALRGRLSRMANDALVGLAALAMNRGEPDHAWRLLQEAVSPRTPSTMGLAEGLAGRLGRGEQLRIFHRGREQPLKELDASVALREELERMRHMR